MTPGCSEGAPLRAFPWSLASLCIILGATTLAVSKKYMGHLDLCMGWAGHASHAQSLASPRL